MTKDEFNVILSMKDQLIKFDSFLNWQCVNVNDSNVYTQLKYQKDLSLNLVQEDILTNNQTINNTLNYTDYMVCRN